MNKPPPQKITAGLYLVATPIGNLRDITLRALDVLERADMIACEDTRMTGKLLHAYDIKTKMTVYNDHSHDGRRRGLLEMVAAGKAVALVSDAGMPLISDPGYKLVRDCLDLGLPVTSLPGANAVLAGVQLSGLPTDSFCFLGFVPPRQAARRSFFTRWKDLQTTLVMYETAPRLLSCLEDMQHIWPQRTVSVIREITKRHEEVRRDTLPALIAHYATQGAPKGEIVLVAEGAADREFDDETVTELLRTALLTRGVKDASAVVAAQTGRAPKALYAMALALKDEA